MPKLTLEVEVADHYSPETIEQTKKLLEAFKEHVPVFVKKQEAYGKQNISDFGEIGVLVRTNDKVKRLKNLIYERRVNELEPVRDTWLDILGYGAIGLLVHDGKW